MKAYKDKTYNHLLENNIRDKILQGHLNIDEYASKKVFEFVQNTQNFFLNVQFGTGKILLLRKVHVIITTLFTVA